MRFGKTLASRRSTRSSHPGAAARGPLPQGAAHAHPVGDKPVDYARLPLFLATRNPTPDLPDVRARLAGQLLGDVAGLEEQLLGVTIQHEQPERRRKSRRSSRPRTSSRSSSRDGAAAAQDPASNACRTGCRLAQRSRRLADHREARGVDAHLARLARRLPSDRHRSLPSLHAARPAPRQQWPPSCSPCTSSSSARLSTTHQPPHATRPSARASSASCCSSFVCAVSRSLFARDRLTYATPRLLHPPLPCITCSGRA